MRSVWYIDDVDPIYHWVDSEALQAAVAAAEANDVLVVARAGNRRALSAVLRDRQGVPLYYWNEPIYPAVYEQS